MLKLIIARSKVETNVKPAECAYLREDNVIPHAVVPDDAVIHLRRLAAERPVEQVALHCALFYLQREGNEGKGTRELLLGQCQFYSRVQVI